MRLLDGRPVRPTGHRPGGAGKGTSGHKELQQVGIELVFVRFREAVGCARVDLQSRVLDELRCAVSRGTDRHNLVVVPVNNERRHIELLEIFGEIRLGERLDAVVGVLVTRAHPLKPERVLHALRDIGAWPVGPKERPAGDIFVKL